MSAGFLQERQDGVFHASGENTDKCRGILRCSADGERGVFVELAKYHSSAVPLPPMIVILFAVVDGTVKISRMRILRNCPYRGTLGAFGACTASRTSHSPSSLRACHFRQHGYMGLCGVSQVALGLT